MIYYKRIKSYAVLQTISQFEHELHVFRHDGHPTTMYCSEVGGLKHSDQVGFRCFVQRHYCCQLEPHVTSCVLGRNLSNQAGKACFSDKHVSGRLEVADLSQNFRPWSSSIFSFWRLSEKYIKIQLPAICFQIIRYKTSNL